jgi:hypothetical protein
VEVVVVVDLEAVVEVVVAGGAVDVDVVWGGAVVVEVDADGPAFEGAASGVTTRTGSWSHVSCALQVIASAVRVTTSSSW